jgi:hypothetical protein
MARLRTRLQLTVAVAGGVRISWAEPIAVAAGAGFASVRCVRLVPHWLTERFDRDWPGVRSPMLH